jgi:two-component system alkaline phosphatase synthesis response regulator PhoP
MLPGIDGMEICKLIRSTKRLKSIPIIMLTAKGEEIDTVLGLEFGADDYISKPFSIRELMARIKSVLRRTMDSEMNPEIISAGGLSIDFQRHEVRKDDQSIEMTHKEFDLLKILVENRGRVMTRELLLEKVWGFEFAGETRTIDVHIRNLRRKIGDDLIITYRGYGYKFRDNGEQA